MIDEFKLLDLNGDGILTTEELVNTERDADEPLSLR